MNPKRTVFAKLVWNHRLAEAQVKVMPDFDDLSIMEQLDGLMDVAEHIAAIYNGLMAKNIAQFIASAVPTAAADTAAVNATKKKAAKPRKEHLQ